MTKRKGKRKGKGFFEDVGNAFSSVGNAVNDGLKRSGIISKALPFLGATAGSLLDPFLGPGGTALGGIAGAAAGDFAKSHGYGHKGMRGAGYLAVPSTLRSAHLPAKELGTIAGGRTSRKGKGIDTRTAGQRIRSTDNRAIKGIGGMKGRGLPTGVFGTVSSDRAQLKM